MSVARSFKKLRRNYQDYGLKVTLNKAGASAIILAFESKTYRIYRIDLVRAVPSPPGEMPSPPGETRFALRLLEPQENDFIRQIEEMEEWLDNKVLEKLRAGSICLLALDGQNVAGFNLISFGEVYMPIVNMTRRFRANEAWSEQITVNKDYRGQGLASTLRLTAFGILKDRGITRFYGGTLPLNIANRKLSRKVGFEEIADIYYRRVMKNKSWATKRISKDAKEI